MENLDIKPNTTVLVLNSTYEPINLASGRRAIVLLLKQKAQRLSSRVIRLLNYVKIPFSKIVSHKPSKSAIYKRDHNKCQYCGSTSRLTIDHIIPRSKGGGDSWFNLVVACSTCNTKKGDKLLEHSGLKLIKQPKAPMNKVQFSLLESNNTEWQQYTF
jgi:5-methylcytosine-specific restriction endonuclease McrA